MVKKRILNECWERRGEKNWWWRAILRKQNHLFNIYINEGYAFSIFLLTLKVSCKSHLKLMNLKIFIHVCLIQIFKDFKEKSASMQ